ncbi:hypothetical protein HYT84_04925, partial [Candidatus Micrarchaeota archaeon]|nr:hypothetical protein [Candidatus Micrarchaeota archaeon]
KKITVSIILIMTVVRKIELVSRNLLKRGTDFRFRFPLAEGSFTNGIYLKVRKGIPPVLVLDARFIADVHFAKDGPLRDFNGREFGLGLQEFIEKIVLPVIRFMLARPPKKMVVNLIKRFEGPAADPSTISISMVIEDLTRSSINGQSKYLIMRQGSGRNQTHMFGWIEDPTGTRNEGLIVFRSPVGFTAIGGGYVELENERLSLIGGSSRYGYPPFSLAYNAAMELATHTQLGIPITNLCVDGRVRYKFDL